MKLLNRALRYLTLSVVAFVAIYGLSYLLLPKIKFNLDQRKDISESNSIRIYISNNGTHSDFIVPFINDIKDWSDQLLVTHTASKNTEVNYLKIGWGDSKIYFETPTWNDLTAANAFKAMIGANESVVRVDFLKSVIENDRFVAIKISIEQYEKLIQYISKSIRTNDPIMHSSIIPVYGKNCAFYPGNGRLSMFNVCNTWVNKGLYEANLPSVFWTIEHQPIFDLYKR